MNERLIDANALLNEIVDFKHDAMNAYDYNAYDVVEKAIRAMPTIDPESSHQVARWVGQYDGYFDGEPVYDVWECSNCGHIIDDGTDCEDDLPNYCPTCGAKMEG